jgi:O-methyltransferase
MTHNFSEDLKQRYIELIKKGLTCALYRGMGGALWQPEGLRKVLLERILPDNVRVQKIVDHNLRGEGLDWPSMAQTMIGFKRLNNLQYCVETALKDGVPGDFVETGVWRGGACILMRAIMKANDVRDRSVWVVDSFEGVPKPDAGKYPADTGDVFHTFSDLAVSMEEVQQNFRAYDLLDEQVKFLKGWFKDTLPSAPIGKLAVARLDGDMYESTMDALSNLYSKLSVGGFLIVDDYGWVPGCKKAVHDFRDQHGISETIELIDQTGAFWRRTR